MPNNAAAASSANSVDAILTRALGSRPAATAPRPLAPTPFQKDMSDVSGDASTLARTMAEHDTSQYTTQLVKWAQDLRASIQVATSPADVGKVMAAIERIRQMPEFDQLPTHVDKLKASVIEYIRTDRPDLYQAAHSQGIL